MKNKQEKQKVMLTPVKAIRAKCLDCCAGSANDVRLCTITDCPLYPYRLGKNPNRSKKYTEEQRKEMNERMKRMREKMKN